MKVVYLDKNNHKEFRFFYEKQKGFSLWQSFEWETFQKVVGRKTIFFGIERNGELVMSALIVVHPLPFGYCYFEVPRGPVFVSDEAGVWKSFHKEIKKLSKKYKAAFCRVNPYEKYTQYSGGVLGAVKESHPPDTILIDLSQSEKEILSQMKQKGRYNIKVAEKKGVTVFESDDISAFYNLIEETTKRDGFSAHNKEYYQKMIQSLGKETQLLLAKVNNTIIAGGIFTYISYRAVYYYGASSNEHRNLMAPYLLQWEAMKEAKKRGCKWYDFLGIAPENAKKHPLAGVTNFKKKFGGNVITYKKGQDIILKPFVYFLYRLKKLF